jgi:AcrR family transcriptional regulator
LARITADRDEALCDKQGTGGSNLSPGHRGKIVSDPKARTARDDGLPEPLYPRLTPRAGADPERVRANQRERLHGAMIEAVTEHGYRATTVSRVIALAGISRKTFYQEFANKETCFLATYDRVVREAMERIQAAYRAGEGGERDWNAGLCRAFGAFAAEIVDRPKPTRLALLDVLAAGPAAHARMERAEGVFVQMIAQSFAQAPEEVAMPQPMLRSLVGGTWLITRSHLLRDRPTAIADAGQELLDWMLAYRHPAVEALPLQVAAPPGHGPERARREQDERTALLRSVAELAAKEGVACLTAEHVARRAGAAPDALSRHFESVDACFFSALKLMSVEAMARAMRESRGAPDWPTAVCRSVRAVLCKIAEDPIFARAAFVAVYTAGPAGMEQQADLMLSFATALVRRAPGSAKPSPLVAEAIVGSIWSIAHRHVVHDRARVLPSRWPHAAYLTLAPIVGAEAALEAIGVELATAVSDRPDGKGDQPASLAASSTGP